jgi:hypothetical protein
MSSHLSRQHSLHGSSRRSHLDGATYKYALTAQTVSFYGMPRVLLPVICLLLWSVPPAYAAEIIRPKVLFVATYETGQERGGSPEETWGHSPVNSPAVPRKRGERPQISSVRCRNGKNRGNTILPACRDDRKGWKDGADCRVRQVCFRRAFGFGCCDGYVWLRPGNVPHTSRACVGHPV